MYIFIKIERGISFFLKRGLKSKIYVFIAVCLFRLPSLKILYYFACRNNSIVTWIPIRTYE